MFADRMYGLGNCLIDRDGQVIGTNLPVGNGLLIAQASAMAALLRVNGIACAVVAQPGHHDWPFAATAFAAALPWLASKVGSVGR